MSSEGNDIEHVMHWKNDNIEIMIEDKAEEFIEETFQSLFSRYQIGFDTTIEDSGFILICVHLLHNECQKINFKQGGSKIGSTDWIKSNNKPHQ